MSTDDAAMTAFERRIQQAQNKSKKRKVAKEFQQEESSELSPHQVLMKLTVGEMSDILRASIEKGQKPYTPLDWEKVGFDLKLKPIDATTLQNELTRYYGT